jgi:hypothetical protein
MTSKILSFAFVVALCGMGCGDDSGGGAGMGSSAGSGSSGSGGSPGGGGTTGGGGTPGGGGTTGSGMVSGSPAEKASMCAAMQMGGMDSNCEGVDEYVSCVQTACDAGYKTCLGANYKSGDFSGGMCESFGDCLASATDCSCTPDGTCMSCFVSNLVSCALSCPLPMCTAGGAGTGMAGGGAGTGAATGGKTCDDLEACCNSLDEAIKMTCLMQLGVVKAAGDVACSAAYSAYASLGCN